MQLLKIMLSQLLSCKNAKVKLCINCKNCRMHIASTAARDGQLIVTLALLGVTLTLNISNQQLHHRFSVTVAVSSRCQCLTTLSPSPSKASASRFLCELSWIMDIIIFIISRLSARGTWWELSKYVSYVRPTDALRTQLQLWSMSKWN